MRCRLSDPSFIKYLLVYFFRSKIFISLYQSKYIYRIRSNYLTRIDLARSRIFRITKYCRYAKIKDHEKKIVFYLTVLAPTHFLRLYY